MLRRVLKTLVIAVLIVTMSCSIVYAKPYTFYPPVETESKVLPRGVKESTVRVTSNLRGVFFIAADLSIINKNGKIGVSGKTYMREPVDEVYVTVYLDRLEADNKWKQVKLYDIEFHSEDYPEGLTEPGFDFVISDQPSGYVYRLRGTFAAFKDGAMEAFGPVTEGILIE